MEPSKKPEARNPETRPTARTVTTDLLARYDQPGPRYTSYPTAVEFDESSITPEVYADRLARADRSPDPLSVYVHLPFCTERCLFCGCHVIITPHMEKAMPYLDLLRREIDMVAKHLPNRRKISQLHFGGGTPTYYSPAQLTELLEHFFQYFEAADGAELAVECDPRVTTPEHLDALARQGFNRISFGVQDFDPKVQEAIGRIQSEEETRELIERARTLGYRGVNVDLIYGLPYQIEETFERSIERVIDLHPDRVAVYSFALVPWIRGHQRKLDESALPDRETKFALFALARERFLKAGYEPIGMDHFALPEDELARARSRGSLRRNFQGYTVLDAKDVLGLGISAIGDVQGAYIQNEKKLSLYEDAITGGRLPVSRGFLRNEDDEVRRYVIGELMCNGGVRHADVEETFGIRFEAYFADALGKLRAHEAEGMVEFREDEIRATPTGELFIRNLALCFDRYWWEKHAESDKPIFSRTV